MKDNKKNILFRLLGIILCLVMLFSAVACNSESTDNGENADNEENIIDTLEEENTEPVETKQVVVFAMKAAAGVRINEQRVKLADVPVTDLPIDPITKLEDVVGKYLLVDANVGVCASATELSVTDPMINSNGIGSEYILFSDIVTANSQIKDTATLIQKAIDENPGKTIYFPDGKYSLTKTVIIPSDPAKSVSIRCSNYAIFSPAKTWTQDNTAIFQYGTAQSAKTQSGDHSDYFMGGIIDGSDSITAIEVYGGGRLFISNVALKNAKIGIHIKPNGAYNIIENINVTSPESRDSKGIYVEGTNNSFTNMRIYHAFIGAHLLGGDNVLVNIHPLANPTGNTASAGFHDQSTGNRYSTCYSDQYPVGFKLESKTRSYFDTCFMYWWQACSNQIGFLCTGEFNSVISDTKVDLTKAESGANAHYIYFATETVSNAGSNKYWGSYSMLDPITPSGEGIIINPTTNGKSDSTTQNQFLYKP